MKWIDEALAAYVAKAAGLQAERVARIAPMTNGLMLVESSAGRTIRAPLDVLNEANFQIGELWGDHVKDRIRAATVITKAVRRAIRWLAAAPRSTYEIRDRLKIAGFDETTTKRTIEILKSRGYLDDAKLAQQLNDRLARQGPMGPRLLEERLRARGIMGEDSPTTFARANLMEAVRAKAASLPRDLDARTAVRRITAYLARRGFDTDEIAEAAATVYRIELDSTGLQ